MIKFERGRGEGGGQKQQQCPAYLLLNPNAFSNVSPPCASMRNFAPPTPGTDNKSKNKIQPELNVA